MGAQELEGQFLGGGPGAWGAVPRQISLRDAGRTPLRSRRLFVPSEAWLCCLQPPPLPQRGPFAFEVALA